MSTTLSCARSATRSAEPAGPGIGVGLVAGVLLLALLQRAPVAGLGAVLPDLGVAPALAAVLTAAPAGCIAVAALAAPVLERRWGSGRVLAGCAGLLVAALGMRVVGGQVGLLVGSLGAYSAIAVAGVVIPAHVRALLAPRRAAALIAGWAAAISAGVGMAGAATPLLAARWGWQEALVIQAVPALLALPLWLRRQPHAPHTEGAAGAVPVIPAQRSRGRGRWHLRLRYNPHSWLLAGFFGLQSLLAVALLSYEPVLLRAAGVEATVAGWMVAVTMATAIVTTMTLGAATTRARHQTAGLVAMTSSAGLGLAGVWLAPTVVLCWVWAVLLGVGISVLGTALALPGLRASDHVGAVRLGAMVQSVGYGLAAAGPATLAFVSTEVGVVFLLGCTVVQLALAPVVGNAETIRPR
ncbi:MFS transporter [Saccharopolyspora griseoalba]|uniref:MFS transporter n=1 Tax=Saccharopolyspora griseoalba TaxID=1431848 RepID=A0ABW2LRT3_9PSEU